MLATIKSGDWLTRRRLTVYPLILLAGFALALGFLLATSDGKMDRADRPLGTDFSQVWTAGVSTLEGAPERAYDNPAHAQKQRDLFGEKTQFYGWHYPPYFLLVASALALLPYLPALLVWQFGTLPLYLACVVKIIGPRASRGVTLATALAFPAVFVNLGHGQNGFLTAGLLAGGLLLLDRRPLLAGVLLGLLAYKPQFGLMIPLALVAGRCWPTLAAAAATLAVSTAVTLLAFGERTWAGFFGSLTFSRQVVLEQGSTGWEKLQSAFAATRMLGGSIPLAYTVQGAVTAATGLAIALIWFSRTDPRLKSATLMAATLLTTPYCLDYDMMILGPALAFAAAYSIDAGFRPYEKSLFALMWLAPLVARAVAGVTFLPLGLGVTMAFFVTLLARAWRDCAGTGLAKRPARYFKRDGGTKRNLPPACASSAQCIAVCASAQRHGKAGVTSGHPLRPGSKQMSNTAQFDAPAGSGFLRCDRPAVARRQMQMSVGLIAVMLVATVAALLTLSLPSSATRNLAFDPPSFTVPTARVVKAPVRELPRYDVGSAEHQASDRT